MDQKKEKFKNDRALRFYYEVLELDRLHYGLWTKEDPLNLDGVRVAQKRYEDFLISEIKAISKKPGDTSVLDVGCGSGVMSESLSSEGFNVEGLSPDLYQQQVFEKRLPGRFHLARFQNFLPPHRYDVCLLSESAQYIPVRMLFPKASECLNPSGFLLVCDYFVLDDAQGPLAKSGHKLSMFLNQAHENGFSLIKQIDITAETTPTLDAAKLFVEKYILTSVDIFSDKIKEKRPRLFKFIMWFFRKKIAKARQNLILIDSKEFARNKKYMFFLFQKK